MQRLLCQCGAILLQMPGFMLVSQRAWEKRMRRCCALRKSSFNRDSDYERMLNVSETGGAIEGR